MGFVAIDWGTSSFRAWLIEDGKVSDYIESDQGVKSFKAGEHNSFVLSILDVWKDKFSFILSIGMIGSSIGLYETRFSPLPISLDDVIDSVVKVPNFDPPLYIVSGVSKVGDVMRGEESQSLAAKITNGLVVLPGTHSKWVKVENNHIVDFRTYLTGELFEILRSYSTLSKATEASNQFHISEDFIRGLDADSSDLTHDLFAIRAHWLQGASKEASVEYLSGLLIGYEIKSAKKWVRPTEVVVVASGGLAKVYHAAFAHFGISSTDSENSNLIDYFIELSQRVGAHQ
jgi:2-dehydro-3-deoxygalactonokinase